MQKRPNLVRNEDLPPEPLQKRSLDKRARLKVAGLSLFGEKGYVGTSVDDVAKRAKLAVGGFYQHFRSKRQLLLVLMDDLLEALSQIDPRPTTFTDVRAGILGLLSHAFSYDLRYLGAYRAWEEAVLSDRALAAKNEQIRAWTTARVTALFHLLQQLPGARPNIDVAGLSSAMDSFFWSLLSERVRSTRIQLDRRIDSATHLIYHALFSDAESPRAQGRRATARNATRP